MGALQCIASRAFEPNCKEEILIFITLDFKKAYDRIDRAELVKIMMHFRLNNQVIQTLISMYDRDTTTIILGNMEGDVEVKSGIRQECTASTFLFKIITFRIIEMIRRGYMYKMGNI